MDETDCCNKFLRYIVTYIYIYIIENFVQFLASGKVCVHEVKEIACDVCLNVFAKWRIEPNDIALLIPTGLMCYMWHVFQCMCEVAVS